MMTIRRRAEPVERDGSWVPSRLRNGLQESVTVNTGRVIPAGTRSTGSVFLSTNSSLRKVSRFRPPTLRKLSSGRFQAGHLLISPSCPSGGSSAETGTHPSSSSCATAPPPAVAI
jgi:hypothetical protein